MVLCNPLDEVLAEPITMQYLPAPKKLQKSSIMSSMPSVSFNAANSSKHFSTKSSDNSDYHKSGNINPF